MSVKVVFVCLGNICRSPSAEGVMRRLVDGRGLSQQIEIDSCGTAPFHVGKNPDPRAIKACAEHGLDISQLIGRQFGDEDEAADYIVPMDHKNLATINGWLSADFSGEAKLLMHYSPQNNGVSQVPDPYHEKQDQFTKVLNMIETACEGLLDHIVETHQLQA